MKTKLQSLWAAISNLGIDDTISENLQSRLQVINRIVILVGVMVLLAFPIHLVMNNELVIHLSLMTFVLLVVGLVLITFKKYIAYLHFSVIMPLSFTIYSDLLTNGVYHFFFFIFPLYTIAYFMFSSKLVRNIYLIIFSVTLMFLAAYTFGIFSGTADTDVYVRVYLLFMGILILYIAIQLYDTQSKRYLNIIEEKERLLDETQLVGKIGSWNYDYNKDLLQWSPTLYQIMGIDSQTSINWETHMSSLFPFDWRVTVQLEDQLTLLDINHTFQKEIDGEARWFNISGKPEKTNGKWKLLGIIQDTTETYLIQQNLRERELFFRSILENTYDGINIVDKDVNFTFMSPSIERILGYQPQELIGTPMIDVVHPSQKEFLAAFFRKAAKEPDFFSTKPQHSIFKLLHKSGNVRYVESNSLNLYNDEVIAGVITNFRDITTDRNTRIALEKNKATLQSILDSTEDWIFAVDRDYRLLSFNQALEILVTSGQEAKLQIGDPLDHAYLFDYWQPYIEVALQGEKVYEEHQIMVGNQDRYYLNTYTPIKNIQNIVIGCAIFSKDITSMRETTLELMQSNQELEQFAYVASHDLQEPLRMVGNFVQLLEQEYADKLDAEAKLYISYAVDGASRMSRLIDDLLKFSRVGRKETKLAHYSITGIIQDKIEDLIAFIKDKNALIELKELPEKLWCEPNQLGIVFQNLIHNGIKFNKQEQPKVVIDTKEMESEWLFSIKDNGIGIAESNVDKIFEIFKRLHRKEVYKGTGIGLALVKRIITRHEGRIWVESELGKGTIFYFTIPKK